MLLVGGLLAVLRDFDPAQALALIEHERLTGGWMALMMFNRCLACYERGRFDLSSFRWLIGGASSYGRTELRTLGERRSVRCTASRSGT